MVGRYEEEGKHIIDSTFALQSAAHLLTCHDPYLPTSLTLALLPPLPRTPFAIVAAPATAAPATMPLITFDSVDEVFGPGSEKSNQI